MIPKVYLILSLTFISVILAWASSWIMIDKKRIFNYLPFILVSFSTLFYVGFLLFSPSYLILDYIFRVIYLISDIVLFFVILRRALWNK